ncbi:hypothetical protein ACWDRS_33695, partial [Streptomyces griseus]
AVHGSSGSIGGLLDRGCIGGVVRAVAVHRASDPGVPYAAAVALSPGPTGVRGAPSPALMPLTADAETS